MAMNSDQDMINQYSKKYENQFVVVLPGQYELIGSYETLNKAKAGWRKFCDKYRQSIPSIIVDTTERKIVQRPGWR